MGQNKMSRFISISFFFFAIICYINAKSLKQHVKDVKQDLQTLKTFFHVPETRTIQIQNNLQQDEMQVTVTFVNNTVTPPTSISAISNVELGNVGTDSGSNVRIINANPISGAHPNCKFSTIGIGSSAGLFGICPHGIDCIVCETQTSGCCV